MLEHVFAKMNMLLNELFHKYPYATGKRKQKLHHQLSLLCMMSDCIIEEWLQFEEKLSNLLKKLKQNDLLSHLSSNDKQQIMLDNSNLYQRGQGYYILRMYKQAILYLKQASRLQPKCRHIQAYLGMSYLHISRYKDAHYHFHYLITLTTDKSVKAIAYNALGCICAKQRQLVVAIVYFQIAHQLDPTLSEPITNLKVCRSKKGRLQLGEKRMIHVNKPT